MRKEILLSFLGAALFWIPLMVIIIYCSNKNDYVFCDEVNTIPIVCKLRYPILNTEEIKKLAIENEELKDKINELQNRLDDVKDVLENGKDDNWEPDPVQIDF